MELSCAIGFRQIPASGPGRERVERGVMPVKRDMDSTTGVKLLRLFLRLMADRNRHFQADLAIWLNCSKQTIIRLMRVIESVVGARLDMGMEDRRRWYQLCPDSRMPLGLDCEELRFLHICRDMACSYLPAQVQRRVDDSLFRLAMQLADTPAMQSGGEQAARFAFFSKGRIDYTPHFEHLDLLLRAREEGRVCRIRYKAAGRREEKEHRFVVGRMLCMNGAIYALGSDLEDDELTVRRIVSLAVHRIQEVSLTDHFSTVAVPEPSPGMFGLPWHEPRHFRIRFAPGRAADYVRERIWADEQRLEDLPDGGVLLEITTCSEPELLAWVRSFGDSAELLAGALPAGECSSDRHDGEAL